MSIVGGDIIAQITGGVFEIGTGEYYDIDVASPAAIVATYIISEGAMTVPSAGSDWPLYISFLPDNNYNVGGIFNSPGVRDGRRMDGGTVLQHDGISMDICSKDAETGWNKISGIALLLDAVHNEDVIIDTTTYRIKSISRIGNVNVLGREPDGARRFLFSLNMTISYAEVS